MQPRSQDMANPPLQTRSKLDAQFPGSSEANADRTTASPLRAPTKPEQPTQFQRFVQEATGRLLPHFGSQLFDSPEGYSPDPGLSVPANYILGPGDEVQLRVWGSVDFAGMLVLDRNGQVQIPKVGVVPLAGVSVRDLEPALRAQLAKVFTNFELNANLGRLRGIQVYVVGQAKQPGTYVVSSLSTLVNALFASGGPNANGSMRNIQLQRAGKTITQFDLYEFLAKGDKTKDVAILPGDVIFIPSAGPRVAVAGAYDQAAIYELKTSGDTVASILALGGGIPATANGLKAQLERLNPGKIPARTVVELALNTSGLQQALQDGDVLTLLSVSPAFVNAVTLQGVVADPLRYPWFEGMKVSDLIPNREALITPDYYKRKNLLVQVAPVAEGDAPADLTGKPEVNAVSAANSGGKLIANSQNAGSRLSDRLRQMVDQINWDYAVIERLNKDKLTVDLIPFNLARAVIERDPAQNLPLLAGDTVTILSQKDLRLPQNRQNRLVRVEGEVAAPGLYQVAAGETLPQLIRRIGGLTPQAYIFGTEFNRESVRVRQQENLDVLVRRLEAQSQSQAVSTATNLGQDRAAQSQALLQQQQIQIRGQIDRLKSLKSNGRVAMELDPVAPNLPPVSLEDGDRILIPSAPAFVSAFGSVNNENVILYKPNKTVGDVIRSAGLTEDAEPDQAFVLRADGSIVAKRDNSGLFSRGFEALPVMPGDTVVVPAQLDRESRYNFVTRALKDWTQILANFGLGAAGLKALQ